MHLAAALRVATERRRKRVDQLVALVHPADHRRALDVHAIARVDAVLAVQRQVVAVLGHHHVRQQRLCVDGDEAALRRRLLVLRMRLGQERR